MSADAILAVIAMLGIGGGLFLLSQARKYRARAGKIGKKEAMPKFETLDEAIRRLPPEQQAEIEAGAEAISAAIKSARLNEGTAKASENEN